MLPTTLALIVAVIVNEAEAPAFKLPTTQAPVAALNAAAGFALTNVNWLGSTSRMLTFVALPHGPKLPQFTAFETIKV